jgi:2-amino-4-hydroxy-6-hydroxymethyldihydropteridine diphosphokinase
VTVYIALGSNVGDRAATLLSAITRIDAIPGVAVRRISRFLETAPEGGPAEQGPYLNAAACLETSLEPEGLLESLQEVEAAFGRDRSREQRWGPRTLDLDILLIDQQVLSSDRLTVPHPRMHQRRFVLEPLALIAPEVVVPGQAKTVADLLAEVLLR